MNVFLRSAVVYHRLMSRFLYIYRFVAFVTVFDRFLQIVHCFCALRVRGEEGGGETPPNAIILS